MATIRLEAVDGKPLEDGFSSKNDKSKTLLLKTKKVSYINTVERQEISKSEASGLRKTMS